MVAKTMARERLTALRETILRLEGENVPGLLKGVRKSGQSNSASSFSPKDEPAAVLPFGISQLDEALQGGLPLSGLMEIRAAETRDAGAAMGFVLGLAVLCQDNVRKRNGASILWIGQGLAASEAGLPYGRGLLGHGLDVRRFIVSRPRTIVDALWIAEAALASPVFAAVILELRGNPSNFALNESRRLHVRARAGHVPVFLLRQAGEEEASSALFRFLIAPAPAGGRPLPDGSILKGSIGNPVFRVTIEKNRAFSPQVLDLEWSSDVRRFRSAIPQSAFSSAGLPADPVPDLSASAGGSDFQAEMGRVVAFKRAS